MHFAISRGMAEMILKVASTSSDQQAAQVADFARDVLKYMPEQLPEVVAGARALIRNGQERHCVRVLTVSADKREITTRLEGDSGPDATIFVMRQGANGLWYDTDAPQNSEGFELEPRQ